MGKWTNVLELGCSTIQSQALMDANKHRIIRRQASLGGVGIVVLFCKRFTCFTAILVEPNKFS